MGYVLVVDQNESLTRLISYHLASTGIESFGVYSVSQAIQCIRDVNIDLIVIDMPTCLKEVPKVRQALVSLAQSQGTLFILLHPKLSLVTAKGDACALITKAVDHLGKPVSMVELARRVKTALGRKIVTTREGSVQLLRAGPLRLDLQKFELEVKGKQVPLTPTEFDLLRCLMQHAGQVISIPMLLQEVWHYPPDTGSAELVRWHIKNLRDKLAQAGCAISILRNIPRRGYVIAL